MTYVIMLTETEVCDEQVESLPQTLLQGPKQCQAFRNIDREASLNF